MCICKNVYMYMYIYIYDAYLHHSALQFILLICCNFFIECIKYKVHIEASQENSLPEPFPAALAVLQTTGHPGLFVEGLVVPTNPVGPSAQYFNVSGSKDHTFTGFWDQEPKILGTWTLCAPYPDSLDSLVRLSGLLGFGLSAQETCRVALRNCLPLVKIRGGQSQEPNTAQPRNKYKHNNRYIRILI